MTTTTTIDETRSTPQDRRQPEADCRRELAGRYGAIGISAVAAAVRYAGAAKNPAYAPVPAPGRLRIDLRFVEAVA